TTDATGTAAFTYSGANTGTDTVIASYAGQHSNSAEVSWLVPGQPLTTSAVIGQFFFSGQPQTPFNLCQCPFDIPPGTTPAFTQTFPSISFNPPSNVIPGNTTIGSGTLPFTDVVTDRNGNFAGTIV